MARNEDGKNQNVWCGKVVQPLAFSHEVKNDETGEVINKFYRFSVEVEVVTNKGIHLDTSVLPIVASEQLLEGLEKEIEVGDVVFVRGSWRPYTVVQETTGQRSVEQVGFAHFLVHSELKDGKSLNRFNFEGYLVDKLYEPERDENGKPVRDKETGKFKPVLDEEGNRKFTVRMNKEEKIVNDFTLAINTKNRSFYIPSLSYYRLARKVAHDIPVGSKVKGSGYIRSRVFSKAGEERVVYEAVVVGIDVVQEDKATEGEE